MCLRAGVLSMSQGKTHDELTVHTRDSDARTERDKKQTNENERPDLWTHTIHSASTALPSTIMGMYVPLAVPRRHCTS